MYLTTENAEQFLGKELDAQKRLFHYYPLTVIRSKGPDGRLLVKDSVGVCTKIPAKDDRFNRIFFDKVDGQKMEE